MIGRIRLRIGDDLIKWLEHLIPSNAFSSETTTFHIADMVSPEMAEALIFLLKKYGHSTDNIKSRISASTSSVFCLHYLRSESIVNDIDLESKYNDRKWDYIIAIPELGKGFKAEAHIEKYMNKANNSILTMISAKPFLDKLTKTGDSKIKLVLKNHLQKVVFAKPSTFGRDSIQMPLAFISLKTDITVQDIIHSEKGKTMVSVLNTVNDKIDTYNGIEGVNLFFGNDSIGLGIIDKLLKSCKNNGSMEDLVISSLVTNPPTNGRYKLYLPAQRGHVASPNQNAYYKSDMWSFFSENSIRGYGEVVYSNVKPKDEYGDLVVRYNYINFKDKNSGINCLNFLKSPIVKLGYMWGKYDTTVSPSSFRYIPLWDFSKRFNEQEYYNKIGLTKKELAWIEANLDLVK